MLCESWLTFSDPLLTRRPANLTLPLHPADSPRAAPFTIFRPNTQILKIIKKPFDPFRA